MVTREELDQHQKPASPFFYGWWIVLAAFLNLFCTTGVIYYGFPVFYPSFVASLGFNRAQVTQGFLLGFLFIGLPCGLFAGFLIDRIGARKVILAGVGFIGIPLILMGFMAKLWQYEVLCTLEIIGYVLGGPIANQVLIAKWFRLQRGRAMGYAYLGLGLGGVISPPTANLLIHLFGWRHAIQIAGALILLVLLPVGVWITRSSPSDLGLEPYAIAPKGAKFTPVMLDQPSVGIRDAIRMSDFWLITAGASLVMGSINAVIQHFIFFMHDHGYTLTSASHFLSALLASSLAGRVLVGYIADRFPKRSVMALFYLVIGASIPLLFLASEPVAAWSFAAMFGFAMGADYMLIPLVTADSFGIGSLGKILAAIITGYTIAQWIMPWAVGDSSIRTIATTWHGSWLLWLAS